MPWGETLGFVLERVLRRVESPTSMGPLAHRTPCLHPRRQLCKASPGAGEAQRLSKMLARALADAEDRALVSTAGTLLRVAPDALPAVLLDLAATKPVRLPEGAELDALVDAAPAAVLLAMLGFHPDGSTAEWSASGSSGHPAMLSATSAAHVMIRLLHVVPELVASSDALSKTVASMLRSLSAAGSEVALTYALNILEATADAAVEDAQGTQVSEPDSPTHGACPGSHPTQGTR